MEIHISDPSLAEELAESLRRSAFRVLRAEQGNLVVEASNESEGLGVIPGAAELELDLYLKVWEITHPGVQAVRIK